MEQPTHPPSIRRLQQARRLGLVPVSRDSLALAALVGGALALATVWPQLLVRLQEQIRAGMVLAPTTGVAPTVALGEALHCVAVLVAPVLGASLLCVLAVGLLQTRALFSLAPLVPRPGRLSPRGRRAAGRSYLWGTGLLKVLGILALAAHTLWQQGGRLLATAGEPLAPVLAQTTHCLLLMAGKIAVLLLLLAVLDLLYTRYRHLRDLRMTRRQLHQERRAAGGHPGFQAERRRVHRDLLAAQDLLAVQRARCVITAGTNLAVALEYDRQTMSAPRVLVAGAGQLAQKICSVARQHQRPVVHRPPLARALVQLEPGSELPRRLWEEAAEVLRESRP